MSSIQCSPMEDLKEIIRFMLEIDKIKNVFRRTPIHDGSRQENDAEHSWHIAVMAMLLKDYYHHPVDLSKTIEMLLVHDLVEVYAGDTYAYDTKGNQDKAEREQAAARKLFGMLPMALEQKFMSLWQEFELMASHEAKYAAALDRFQPFLLNYYNDGKPWIEHGITREQVIDRMLPALEANDQLKALILEMIENAYQKGYLQ